jgi:Big-like domain-containing protein
VPAELSLRVPPDIACGKYLVHIDGRTISGQSISEHIELDVERPDTPIQLSFLNDYRQLEFVALGEPFHMNVLATFSDGRILDVTESSRVTYHSSNTNVATVDGYGAITPVGIGRAPVSAIYANGDRDVRVAIPVNVPGLTLTVSSHSLTFHEQAISTTSTPERLTLTNTSTGPITVVEISAGGEDFVKTDNCFTSIPLPVGASCMILVSFKPTQAGHSIGVLKIYNSFSSDDDVISLSGTGVRR